MRQEYLLKTHQGQADFIDTCTTSPNGILVQMLKNFEAKKASDNDYYEHLACKAADYHKRVGLMYESNVFSIILKKTFLNEDQVATLTQIVGLLKFFHDLQDHSQVINCSLMERNNNAETLVGLLKSMVTYQSKDKYFQAYRQ